MSMELNGRRISDAGRASDPPVGPFPWAGIPFALDRMLSRPAYFPNPLLLSFGWGNTPDSPQPLTKPCDMTVATMASPTYAAPPAMGEASRSDMDVVELPLLLPRWQAQALEAAATRRGMTTGQILRRVIGDLFGNLPTTEPKG